MKIKRSFLALAIAGLLSIPFAVAVGEPQNVTGLQANAISASAIGLSWGSARDANGGLVDHYRIYYGKNSVQTAGEGEYENEVDTSNNNTSYVVPNLEPGIQYYFSATAFDNKGVESEAYSLEVNATTLSNAAGEEIPELTEDTTPPTVVRVTAPYKTRVIVELSEPVVLPAEAPESAFSINGQLAVNQVLSVLSVQTDDSGTQVMLETAPQTAGTGYVVTVGVAVMDAAGNPIVSGNTDSGLFTGSDLEAPQEVVQSGMAEAPAEALVTEEPTAETPVTEEPVVEEPAPVAAPLNCGNDTTCFYNNLKTCASATLVEVADQTQTKQEVTGLDGESCVVKHEVASILDLQNPKTVECRIPASSLDARVARITDNTGKLFENEAEARGACTGTYLNEFVQAMFAAAPVADTTPPENITNLVLTFREELEKFIVMLHWVASLNSAGDLVDQILYQSMDRGQNYDAGSSLGSSKTDHEVPNLEGGKEYTFKITTKDASGNESTGVVKSIRLPQTGAAVGLLLMGSVLGAYRALRRKK